MLNSSIHCHVTSRTFTSRSEGTSRCSRCPRYAFNMPNRPRAMIDTMRVSGIWKEKIPLLYIREEYKQRLRVSRPTGYGAIRHTVTVWPCDIQDSVRLFPLTVVRRGLEL